MKFDGKEQHFSKRAQKHFMEWLEQESWNSFYDDRRFGGSLLEEAKQIEHDLHERIGHA